MTPEQLALAIVGAIRSIADQADEAVQPAFGEALHVAVTRALDLDIPAAEVRARTGYSGERFEQIQLRSGPRFHAGNVT